MSHRIFAAVAAAFLALAYPCGAIGASTAGNGHDGGYDDLQTAKIVQGALQANDRKTVAELVRYPLRRIRPLPPIQSSEDFLRHWDEFFDTKTIAELLAAKPEEMGWRGVMLNDGDIWFDGGRITAVNLGTAVYKRVFAEAKRADSARLYKDAKDYTSIQFECPTATYYIRTQYHGRDLRYFAWKRGAGLAQKPDLEIRGGDLKTEGSGGNATLTFNKGRYTYVLYDVHVGPDYSRNHLEVFKDGKSLLRQDCLKDLGQQLK